jgi:hypothetical protein
MNEIKPQKWSKETYYITAITGQMGIERETESGKGYAILSSAQASEVLRNFQEQLTELKAKEDMLGNLLAVLHRDGGHHEGEVGTKQAVEDAINIHYSLRAELDEMRVELDETREALDDLAGEPRTMLSEAYYAACAIQGKYPAHPDTKDGEK